MLSATHRDISKVIMQFVVEEIDENTSLEDLQKMMVVALVYRVLVCFYEVSEQIVFIHGHIQLFCSHSVFK